MGGSQTLKKTMVPYLHVLMGGSQTFQKKNEGLLLARVDRWFSNFSKKRTMVPYLHVLIGGSQTFQKKNEGPLLAVRYKINNNEQNQILFCKYRVSMDDPCGAKIELNSPFSQTNFLYFDT